MSLPHYNNPVSNDLLTTIRELQIPSTPHNNQPIIQRERRSKSTTVHHRFSSNLITMTGEPSGRREVVLLVGPKSGGSGS
jgi:hypothetical protein